MNTEELLRDAIKQELPGLKTQAQFDCVVGFLGAAKATLNAILEQKSAQDVQQLRDAVATTLDTLVKVTELSSKLEEVPEAASGPEADKFKVPPVEFSEREVLDMLLQEVAGLGSIDTLNTWYASTKERRDHVKTQALRNILMDAIRAKKTSL